ncbi:GntR family transcriptional regulator [Streptomyces fractus]|uniref:GntR family transcriptional regulator n=1 Tax=Streptomyces fractus TaxID=641806 RepID=UPI003CE9138B
MTTTPIRPAERAESAFVSLRTAIVDGAVPPGTRLPEDVLAAQYGVSRTLVRSVLARLVAAGLVETGKAKSATVARPDADEARAVFEVRRSLERDAVRLAAAAWDKDASASMARHVRAEREASERDDHRVSGRLAAEFHVRLAELCGNPLMERYLSEVVWRCSLILSVHGAPHDQRKSIDEHEELLRLIETGDAEGAEESVLRHVRAVETRTLARATQAAAPNLAAILGRY